MYDGELRGLRRLEKSEEKYEGTVMFEPMTQDIYELLSASKKYKLMERLKSGQLYGRIIINNEYDFDFLYDTENDKDILITDIYINEIPDYNEVSEMKVMFVFRNL